MCGISKSNSSADFAALEYCIREDLKPGCKRMLAVLHPLKLIIDNYPEGQVEMLEADNNLENPELGKREIPFGRELWIERDDFMEVPPRKYYRLFPGNEVRLMYAYFVKCVGFDKDEDGNITAVHVTYDPETKSGSGFTGRKVKGTIHWVAAKTAVPAEVRLYDYLMETDENGNLPEDFIGALNKNSLEVIDNALVEPSVKLQAAGKHYQFLRTGYFVIDPDTTPDKLVFNRVVGLRDSWAKEKNK
jgi:glutaminyl-tRNA synthetase